MKSGTVQFNIERFFSVTTRLSGSVGYQIIARKKIRRSAFQIVFINWNKVETLFKHHRAE